MTHMGRATDWNDPFGAPEFLIDGVAYREMVGSEMLRLGCYSNEQGERILRVKLVVPCVRVMMEQNATWRFLLSLRRDLFAGAH